MSKNRNNYFLNRTFFSQSYDVFYKCSLIKNQFFFSKKLSIVFAQTISKGLLSNDFLTFSSFFINLCCVSLPFLFHKYPLTTFCSILCLNPLGPKKSALFIKNTVSYKSCLKLGLSRNFQHKIFILHFENFQSSTVSEQEFFEIYQFLCIFFF